MVEANANAIVVSGSFWNYPNGDVINQLTDVIRGESVVLGATESINVTEGLHCTLYHVKRQSNIVPA
jgi:hypothetical protein